jgi:hypothetical protein
LSRSAAVNPKPNSSAIFGPGEKNGSRRFKARPH